MKNLWLRFVFWFGLTFMVVSAVFVALSYRVMEGRLPSREGSGPRAAAERFYPESAAPGAGEVYWSREQLTRLEALYGAAVLLAFVGAALWCVRLIREPLRSLNEQLEAAEQEGIGRQVSVDDATAEVRRLETNINNQLARARLALVHLNRYAAQVAHELRTPLTVMRLKLEQAADKIDPKLAEEIQAELLRLTMYVEQSLLVARAEQGHLTLNPVRFDLAALLGDVVDDYRLLTREQGREVVFVAEPGFVLADPKYVTQILHNLLNNALRHGTGPVRVRLVSRREHVAVLIGNQIKAPVSDHLNLSLGKRIVAALVGLHGNMVLRTRRLGGWHFVRLTILLS